MIARGWRASARNTPGIKDDPKPTPAGVAEASGLGPLPGSVFMGGPPSRGVALLACARGLNPWLPSMTPLGSFGCMPATRTKDSFSRELLECTTGNPFRPWAHVSGGAHGRRSLQGKEVRPSHGLDVSPGRRCQTHRWLPLRANRSLRPSPRARQYARDGSSCTGRWG